MGNANLVTRAMMTYVNDIREHLITRPSANVQHWICASENLRESHAVSRGTFMRHIDRGDGGP